MKNTIEFDENFFENMFAKMDKEEKIRREAYNFVQAEGFLPDGTECETLDEWLKAKGKADLIEPEPFQKGDLNYNNM